MKNVSRAYYKSSSFKMAAFFTMLLGGAGLLLAFALYDLGKQNFIRESEAAIDHEMNVFLSGLKTQTVAARLDSIQQLIDPHSYTLYLLLSKEGQVLGGTDELLEVDFERITEGLIQFQARLNGDMRFLAAKIHTFEDGQRLLIARNIDEIIRSFQRLKHLSLVIMFFMLIVVVTSVLISTFVVNRINVIANTAKSIMDTGDLSRRISIYSHWDDLSNLAQILNALLDRVECLMMGIRQVSDNIAHDLRTPLTRIRNRLESASGQALGAEDVQSILHEADALLDMFSALLRIARVEKGQGSQEFLPISLNTLLLDVIELYEPVAEDKSIKMTVELSEQATIEGDRDLLFQVFANLIDNAIKFTPSHGCVRILLKRHQTTVDVFIEDTGIGIAEQEYEKVFQRFYRADNSRQTYGSGLGLSLVKAALDCHRAQISLEKPQRQVVAEKNQKKQHTGLIVRLTFHITDL